MAWSRAIGAAYLLAFLASHVASGVTPADATTVVPNGPSATGGAIGLIGARRVGLPVHDDSVRTVRLDARKDWSPIESLALACPEGAIAGRCGGEAGCFPPGFECCGDGRWCDAGERCVACGAGPSRCVPVADEQRAVAQCCSDGSACPGGTACGSCGTLTFCYAGPTVCCDGTPHPGEACP
jgi:hypothetical protein